MLKEGPANLNYRDNCGTLKCTDGYSKARKQAITMKENKSNLVASIRVPDWVYLLAKVRMCISDAAWYTLLNLTQLGRTAVSNRNRRININD